MMIMKLTIILATDLSPRTVFLPWILVGKIITLGGKLQFYILLEMGMKLDLTQIMKTTTTKIGEKMGR
jgi:hypothetical protein